MAKQTAYHNWSVPEAGDTDYETTFDSLFDNLDTEIVEKGTKSNRPLAGAAGRWYLATDELVIYYDDGTAWQQISAGDHVDVENTNGTSLVTDVDAIQAAANCSFTDHGDNTVALDASDTRVDVENTDGTPLVTNVGAIQAGQDLDFSDDTDGTVTLNASGGSSDTQVTLENTDGTALLSDPDAIQAGNALTFADDGDNTATLNAMDGWNLVDLVDAGADPTGGTDVVPVLNSIAANDTLVVVPPGTYKVDQQFSFNGFTRFGIIAPAGGATFKLTAAAGGDSTVQFLIGSTTNPGGEAVFKNLTFDATTAGAGMSLVAYEQDRLVIDNCRLNGKVYDDNFTLQPGITTTSGSADVQWHAMDGFEDRGTTSLTDYAGGIYVHPDHVGRMRFKDCSIGAFPNNGLYASDANGHIRVEGGFYKNNNVSDIRMPDGATVRDATIRHDGVPYTYAGSVNQKGIKCYYGEVTVDGCTYYATGNSDTSAKGVTVTGTCERATIHGCQFVLSGSRLAIAGNNTGTGTTNHGITVSDSTIEGSAGSANLNYAVATRPKMTFENVHIYQPNRGGIYAADRDFTATGCYVVTSGTGINLQAAYPTVRDCRAASSGSAGVYIASAASDGFVKDNFLDAAPTNNGTNVTVSGNITGWTA